MINPFLANKKFIILKEKTPTHKLTTIYTWNEVKDEKELGILVDDNYVVLDIDDEEESLALKRYLEDQDISCNIMKTTRGRHFWFKLRKPIKNVIGIQNAIGISCDVRASGRKCFVVIKYDNVWRHWERLSDTLDYIPDSLVPINDKLLNKCIKPIGLKEGDGRRDALFTRIIPLKNAGFNKEKINNAFTIINKYLFDTPLSATEIESTFVGFEAVHISAQFFDKDKKFLHHKFARYIHQQLNGLFMNGRYHFYDSNLKVYNTDERILFSLMNEVIDTLNRNQRNEVLAYMWTLPNNVVEYNPYILNVKNGLYDLENNVFMEHTEKYFTTNQINAAFNIAAKEEIVYSFLKGITLHDRELIELIGEVIGNIFVTNNNFPKAAILFGGGLNGKSTFIEALENVLGYQNISGVGMEELNERFKRSALVGKLANFCSELSDVVLKESHTFKKLVTGDTIDAEFKHKQGFNFKNYAKFIFSTNTLPSTKDKSYGFYRRLLIIPFEADFTGKEDLRLLKKLTSAASLSTWLNIGIEGYKRLSRNGMFTNAAVSKKALEKYQIDNNSVLLFITDEYPFETLINMEVKETYELYKRFCILSGLHQVSFKKFKTEIISNEPELIPNTIKIGTGWVTRWKRVIKGINND